MTEVRQRPYLRNCPFCNADGANDEVVAFLAVVDVVHQFTHRYVINCFSCGAEVSDEYEDEVIRLWNGEPPKNDEEDAA